MFSGQYYKRKIQCKSTKEKPSLSRIATYFILLTRRDRGNISLDAVFLHTTTVAKEIHLIYLLLILRLKLLSLHGEPSL